MAFSAKRWQNVAGILGRGACVVAVLMAVNWAVAAVAPGTWDVTDQRRLTLSPLTRDVLARVDGTITVTIFAEGEIRTTRERSFDRIATMLFDLLKQYQQQCPTLRVERVTANESAAGQRLKLHFPDITAPCVVLTYEASAGALQHEVLRAEDLAEFYGASDARVAAVDFFGEQSVTAAIARLIDGEPPTRVYCLTGHGEMTLDVQGSDSTRSLSELVDYLRLAGIELLPLDLTQQQQVPADADVLLLAGPQAQFDTADEAKLEMYFKHGGAGLLLLDLNQNPQNGEVLPTGLDALLRKQGVLLGDDLVVTTTIDNRLSLAVRALPAEGEHSLTKVLPRAALELPSARSVRLLPVTSTKARCTPLLVSPETPQSWAETDLATGMMPQWNAGRDLPGPVSLAVAVERMDRAEPAPMLVVVGDAEFASNRGITGPRQYAAESFLLKSLHWLSGKKRAWQDIPARRRRPYQLAGTLDEQRGIVWKTMAFLSAVIATAGATVWTIRRNG